MPMRAMFTSVCLACRINSNEDRAQSGVNASTQLGKRFPTVETEVDALAVTRSLTLTSVTCVTCRYGV